MTRKVKTFITLYVLVSLFALGYAFFLAIPSQKAAFMAASSIPMSEAQTVTTPKAHKRRRKHHHHKRVTLETVAGSKCVCAPVISDETETAENKSLQK